MPMLRPAVLFLGLVVVVGGCQKPMEEFTSTEWKFKAKFPGKPDTKQQAGPFNTKLNMFMTTARDGGFMIGVADMPIPEGESPAEVQARLDGSRDGAVSNIGGTLQSSSAVTLQGKYPGREFTAKLPPPPKGPKEGIVRAKIYLVGKRLYQIMVIGTTSFATSPSANEFLDSFQVTD